jgi:acetylornithine/succinyldiaminopimelate/putrescine aminotransferase
MPWDKMEKEVSEKVHQSVYKQFPYLQGVEPEVSDMENDEFLLIYKGQATTANGHALPVSIRVVSDKTGKIKKISSSR